MLIEFKTVIRIMYVNSDKNVTLLLDLLQCNENFLFYIYNIYNNFFAYINNLSGLKIREQLIFGHPIPDSS